MRKKSRGEAEGDEKRVDVESNAGKLRRRNEVVVEEVYLKIAEGAKRVRQEGCDRKSKKRRRAKKFGVGELVMVRVDRKLKQDPFYEGVFEVVKFVKEKAEYQLARKDSHTNKLLQHLMAQGNHERWIQGERIYPPKIHTQPDIPQPLVP